jgi:hypothetical protein
MVMTSEETEVPMAPEEATAVVVQKTQETKVETKAEKAARLREEARLAAEVARRAAEAADAADAAAEQEEAEAAEAAAEQDEAEREEIEGKLRALNEKARTLTEALDALDARKEERKKKRKRSRRIEEAGEAGEAGGPEQHQNEEEEKHQNEETKTKRRRMFACDYGYYGQGYCGDGSGIPVVDAGALGEWEKNLTGFKMVMVEREVCDGPREPRLTAVYEDVHGSRELAAELDAKYSGRVVKAAEAAEAAEAEGLDGLLGRHGLECRVFAVERNRSADWGPEPETLLETKRVWLQRGSEALRVLDELIARERRPASPTRPAPVASLDRATEPTPWEPHPVWEPPRSPRSPAYRPVRPQRPSEARKVRPVYNMPTEGEEWGDDDDERLCVD